MAIVGKDGKVTLGSNTVVGMGTWAIDGITVEEFDSSAFGDTWKSFQYGMKDGGTVSFNGHYNPTDCTHAYFSLASSICFRIKYRPASTTFSKQSCLNSTP